MIGQPRIGTKALAMLCRRMSMSLGAGVDARTVWAREASNVRGLGRSRFAGISDEVARGNSISEALDHTGKYFPEFFRRLVKVGEQSGHLPEVFRQLAEHYEHQIRLRRNLMISLSWPILELVLALSVVGVLIFLMGAIPQLKKANIDILGFGLVGAQGLATYLAILGAIALGLAIVYRATSRGMLWVAPIQRMLMMVPRLGKALETFAMARLAWAMHVTLNSGMDLRNAMQLSLASTENVLYTRHTDAVLRSIRAGHEVHEALAETRAFPIQFIDAVQVGEESGQLVESMGHMATQYQHEARSAMNTITVVMGVLVTALIAGVIIFLIFRVFSFYTGVLDDALHGK
jgi:type IV pilus assembly protein PilC